jgi:sulfur-carrier protein
MVLTVKLFGAFRAGRFDVAQLARPPGATVASVLDDLGLPRPAVGLVTVGGRVAHLEHPLEAGDTIAIFPGASA